MLSSLLRFRWSKNFASALFTISVGLLIVAAPASAQSTATLQGTITDTSNAAVPNAKVVVHNQATGVERTTQTDQSGSYLVPGLLPGLYTVTVSASGFQSFVIRDLKLDVATTATENAELKVGQVTQEVVVSGGAPLVNTSTPAVGQVINQTTVQQIPLNGRHFVDLGLLVPGTVTPPQNGFLTAPLRGQGSFAINTAGQREDTTNWLLNGINLSDEVQNQITFQPSIDTVSEFKIDNSTFPAEYGRNSGAIVNIATRSGANDLHGELFDFLRNNFFDARNFFNPKPKPQAALIRNDFGADAGGPIKKNKAFFFGSYEGLRQHQAISTVSTVLSAADRAQVAASSDAAIQALTAVIPQANSGTNTFLGASVANVQIDQGAGDLEFVVGPNDRVHGYYALQEDVRQEPTLQYAQNNALPGWGDTRSARRQIMTLEEDHVFGPTLSNEARLGYNRVSIHFTPNQLLNPTDFSINDGITNPIGIPQFSIGASALQFGGPAGFPQGRGDLTVVGSDTVRYIRGNHSMAVGGEIRRFYNNNFNLDGGSVSFAGIPQFIADQPSTFAINLSNGASKLLEPSWGIFAQDAYKLRPNLTLNLGLRYDYNYAISDAQDRFVEFDPATAELIQVGTNGFDQPFQSDAKLVQPRVGVAWDPWGDGKTSVRLGYAILADQPVTNIVTGQTTNPPFGDPLNVNSAQAPTLALTNAAAVAGPAGLAPSTIFRGFRSPYVQSYNFTIQREITPLSAFRSAISVPRVLTCGWPATSTSPRLGRKLKDRTSSSPRFRSRPFLLRVRLPRDAISETSLKRIPAGIPITTLFGFPRTSISPRVCSSTLPTPIRSRWTIIPLVRRV